MKQILVNVIIIFIAVLHVHLNMFTVENSLNPSTIIGLGFSTGSMGGEFGEMVEDILIMCIHCIVTFLFASVLFKWKEIGDWLLSLIICVVVYLIIWKHLSISADSALCHGYESIYGYGGAYERCIKYSILQIVFTETYYLMASVRRIRPGESLI